MRRTQRIVLLTWLVLLAPMLAGCADFDADKLDIFGLSEKKKLPGDRRPVFPEGVPGVSQGIPPEFMKGNQPSAEAAVSLPAEPEKPAEPAKKTAAVDPATKPKAPARAKTSSRPPTRITVRPASQDQQPAPAQQQGQAPWPEPAPAQTQGQSTSTAPWPASPAPGTFSR